VWVWIKHYWYIPALLIYTFVLWVIFRKKNNNLVKLFDITKESYEKQIQDLNKAHEEEIEKRNELIVAYQNTLKSIEEEHNIKLNDLDNKKKKEVEELTKNFESNPSELAEEMKKLFGV